LSKILIVEDDRATTGLLKTVFEMEGFKALVCPQANRVVETVRRDRPDVVFMDYHLAESESLPVLRELKADAELRSIPVVMTSGLDRSKECAEAGAAGFLIKPFRPSNLLERIRAVLNETKPET
jgi:DNA-binding response OmpR family regulator